MENSSEDEKEQSLLDSNFSHMMKFIENLKTMDMGRMSKSSKDQLESLKQKIASLDGDSAKPGPSRINGPSSKSEEETDSDKNNKTADKIKQKINDGYETDTEEYENTRMRIQRRKSRVRNPEEQRSRRRSTSEPAGYERLIRAMNKLDMGKTPTMEKLGDETAISMEKYLKRFEQYCKDSLKENKMYWINELEVHLEGKTLAAFKSLKDEDDDYPDIKLKLLQWDQDMKESRKIANKQKFKEAKVEENESLFLYSARLERLFKNAYPDREVNKSKKLAEKFMDTIPKNNKKQFNDIVFAAKIRNETIDWKQVQRLARMKDVENNKQVSKEEPSKPKEIMINTAQCNDINNANQNNLGYNQQWQANRFPQHGNRFPGPRFDVNPQNSHYNARQFTNSARGTFQQNGVRYNGNANNARFPGPPPQDVRRANMVCNYCTRYGHEWKKCRVRMRDYGLCFSCGEQGHGHKFCNKNRRISQNANNNRASEIPGETNGRDGNNKSSWNENRNDQPQPSTSKDPANLNP